MERFRIIIVDDEPITRMDVKEMLVHEGYDVVGEGRNGEEAVELCYELKPDLAIMDVKMPKLDGIKASQIIQQQGQTAVVLLTAYSQRELVSNARKSGVTAYLVKPVTEEDLIPAIEIALGQREKFQCLTRDIHSLKERLEERKVIEKAKGIIMWEQACSEEAAYQWMRTGSMQKRISLFHFAKQILGNDL